MRASKNVAYITKDSSKEDVYKAYTECQRLLKMERHRMKKNQGKIAEVRKQKNEKYNALRYQLLKRDQKIYKLQKHIFNLQRFAVNERVKAKKKGIEIGKGKVRAVDYSVIKMHDFLLQVEQVSDILGMKLGYCAFILWCGRYSFFTITDFKNDNPNTKYKFHGLVSYFKKNKLIDMFNTSDGKSQFALTALGLDMFNKIDRFTKKHFNE